MIKRKLQTKIVQQLSKFPVIAITGPRQSGKTTLAQSIGSGFEYYNLENLLTKRLVAEDPVAFIKSIKLPAIIDEIQKYPELLSQIQVHVDATSQAGMFIITGSESLLLSEKISQSLAGRLANNTLLPLAFDELGDLKNKDVDEQILMGFYPRIYSTAQTRGDFYPEFINTYVEKDVRSIQNIGNLALFEKFLQLIAGRVGQLLNLTSLSNDLGVSHVTIERWISLLEASYIAYRLQPYHQNLGKRLVKSPKIYFYDTGILAYLLGINSVKELRNHYAYGGIYENLIITEVYKKIYNEKLHFRLYFYKDSNGSEVDLLVDTGSKILGMEIKSAETFSSDFTKGLKSLSAISKSDFSGVVVYKGAQIQKIGDFELINIENLSEILSFLLRT